MKKIFSPNELLLLLVLAAVQFTHIMDFMIMMPLGPQLMRLFHISPQQFGLLVSAYTFSAGLTGFFSAFHIDRFDRKKALIVLYIGFIFGTLACALAPNFHFLLGARTLTGAFGGILAALILSMIGDAISAERRASAMGIVMVAFSVASVLGVPFGLYLANLWSWHAPFFFLAGIGIGITGLIAAVVPTMKQHIAQSGEKQPPLTLLTDIFHNKNQLLAMALTIMTMFGQFAVIPFLSPSMVANVGFSEHQLTYIYLVGGAVTIFTGPLVGRISDLMGKPLVFTVAALLSIIPLYLITHMGPTTLPLALLVTTSFFIFTNGRMIPMMALISSTVLPRQRGGFMSINSCVQQLSSGCAALVAGLIIVKDAQGHLLNYSYVGYLAIVMTLLCILIANRIKAVDGAPAV